MKIVQILKETKQSHTNFLKTSIVMKKLYDNATGE